MKKNILIFLLLLLSAGAFAFEEPLTTENCQSAVTSGGNYTADAMRYAARTEIAFVVSSDLRHYVSSSEPSADELVSMIAVKKDKVYSFSLTGKQIMDTLRKAYFLYPRANPSFLHLSGMRVTLGKDRELKAEVLAADGSYEPLQEGVLYSAAMSQSLAEGVLGYWKLWDFEDGEEEEMSMGEIIPLYSAEQNQRNPFEKRLIEVVE